MFAKIEKLVAGIGAFKKSFIKSDGTPLIVDEQFDALAESEIKRATVTRTVRS